MLAVFETARSRTCAVDVGPQRLRPTSFLSRDVEGCGERRGDRNRTKVVAERGEKAQVARVATCRANLPTVYLDHAQLVDAFHGADGLHEQRGLAAFVERSSREANVCLSVFHLLELSDWDDDHRCAAMCSWLETLDLVWTDSGDRAKWRGAEEALIRQVNLLETARYAPFIRELADVYQQWNPAAANELRTSPRVSTWVGRCPPLVQTCPTWRMNWDDSSTLRLASSTRNPQKRPPSPTRERSEVRRRRWGPTSTAHVFDRAVSKVPRIHAG